MGDAFGKTVGGLAGALDPSTPLTIREAATLADCPVDTIEAQIADGSLLSERQRKGAREHVVVRLLDLADVYPHVLGRRPEPATQPPVDSPIDSPIGSPAEPAPTRPTASTLVPEATDEAAAIQDLSAGASRHALIELCQDLETRLDLAERERQASTASLLMAQRRVLDLEAKSRPSTWVRAGGAAAMLMSACALAFVLAIPSKVEAALEGGESRAKESLASLERRQDARRAELDGALQAQSRALAASQELLQKLEGELATARDASLAAAAVRDAELASAREAADADRAAFELILAGTQKELASTHLSLADERARLTEERADRDRERRSEDALRQELAEGIASLRKVADDHRADMVALARERAVQEAKFERAVARDARRAAEEATAALERGANKEAASAPKGETATETVSWWRRLFSRSR